MTAIEVAKQELSRFGLTEEQIVYELSKKGIDKDLEVTDIDSFVNSKSFELLKADVILNSILSDAENWSQGDRSEKRNFDALKSYVSAIYRKYGLTDPFVDQSKIATITRL